MNKKERAELLAKLMLSTPKENQKRAEEFLEKVIQERAERIAANFREQVDQ